MPFVLKAGRRTLTRISLSFALGYVLLATAGMLGSQLNMNPIILQIFVAMSGVILCLRYYFLNRSELKGSVFLDFDREDWIVLGSFSLYLVICILFFDRLVIWMAGDAVAHAEMIRMLIEGQTLPINLPLLGNYWEYYPKGFHYYAYFWTKAFPLLDVVQTVPALINALTPMLLYSILREMRQDSASSYAFLLSSFAFSTHYSYLIWGGYPSAAAEMLLVAAVLASVLKMRIILIAMFLGMLFTHPRILALGVGFLLFWWLAEDLRQRLSARHFYMLASCFLFLVAAYVSMHRPEYLVSVFSDQDLASQFVARWYPGLLALFGAAIAAVRGGQLNRMVLVWTGSWILAVLMADAGLLSILGTADRLMLSLYLPLSILAALALESMDGGDVRIRASFLLVLIAVGAASMGMVLYSYAGSWGLPQEDYDATIWLSGQNLSDAVCINVDEIGAWIYPLTGIPASNPRIAAAGFAYGLPERIRIDPGNSTVVGELRSIGHQNVLIYVSSVSALRPGHTPPFAGHEPFPLLNLSYPEEVYELLYDKGARIYRVRA